jgi:hypothetical protein
MTTASFSRTTAQAFSNQTGLYFGKYRGKVTDNADPLLLGRIMAKVPSVPGMQLNWAMPNTPYAGERVGFYAIPPVGADVWIEFEGGDPNYPIWAGCFWSEGQTPVLTEPLQAPLQKVFKTQNINMVLDDTPEEGGFRLTVSPPSVNDALSLLFNAEGIQINCPESRISLTPENIIITVPESVITITPETVTIEVPDSTISVTGETITVNNGGSVVTLDSASIEVETPELEITANASIEGAVEIEGDLEITGAAEIVGDTNVTGAVEVEGETNILGALTVEGETNITPALTIEGETNIAGALTVEGDAAVAGAIEGVLFGAVVPPI